MSLEAAYFVIVTLFQFGLAALVATTSRLDAARGGVALVIAMSGVQTLYALDLHRYAWVPPGFLTVTDCVILLTLALVLAQFPTPLGGVRGRRAAVAAWGVAAAAAAALILPHDQALNGHMWSYVVFHEGPFALAAGLLAFRLAPAWTRLQPGPLRTQSALIGGGLGIGLFYQSVHFLRTPFVPLPELPTTLAMRALQILTAYFAIVTLLRVLAEAVRGRAGEAWAFAGILALGAGVALVEIQYLGQALSEFSTQAVRPLVFAIAMLRFDVFDVHPRVRRLMVPVTGIFLALILFVTFTSLYSRGGLALDAVEPVAALVSVASVAVVFALLWMPLSNLVSAAQDPRSRRDRLERYRLALERSRAANTRARDAVELAELRRRLGVSLEEHAVLQGLLASNLVIPTSAVSGARRGDVVADRYEVERELGRGGFGRAFLARDRATGRRIVLKQVLRPWEDDAPRRRAGLEREAEAGALVNSPHVARALDIVSDGYNTYLVREHVPGETLAERVARLGPLPPSAAAGVARDVLAGLRALHDARLLHLDLKPQNVILRDDGTAVIIDAGAGRRGTGGAATAATATPSSLAGTPGWMPPEQASGSAVDERTDVYAAGALLHYALTGRPPAAGAHLPPPFRRVLARALAPEPRDRYARATDFAAELARALPPPAAVADAPEDAA